MAHSLAAQPALVLPASKSASPPWYRVVALIVGPVAWLCLTLLYVAFWARNFTLFQSVVVVLVSIILLAGLMAALWASWGMRQVRWAWGE
jgi:hypothetical protein